MNLVKWIALLAVVGPPAAAQDSTKSGGTLVGSITFEGDLPKVRKTVLTDEQAAQCKCKEVSSEAVVVDEKTRGIRWVCVEIVGAGGEWKPSSDEKFVVDQKNCVFTPHVRVVPVGATVEFKNSDEMSHNVHSLGAANPPANLSILGGQSGTQKFDWAEKVGIKCDIHDWMSAWLVVTKNRFHALTDEKGEFTIKDIPPGKYKVQVWHEKLKGVKEEIELTAGGKVELNLKLKK